MIKAASLSEPRGLAQTSGAEQDKSEAGRARFSGRCKTRTALDSQRTPLCGLSPTAQSHWTGVASLGYSTFSYNTRYSLYFVIQAVCLDTTPATTVTATRLKIPLIGQGSAAYSFFMYPVPAIQVYMLTAGPAYPSGLWGSMLVGSCSRFYWF